MMDLDARVKAELEPLTCPTHHQHPQLIMEPDRFDIKCCCPEFKISCALVLKYIYIEYKRRGMRIGA